MSQRPPVSFFRIFYFTIACIYLVTIPVLLWLNLITPRDFVTFIGIIPLGIIALYQEQLKRWFLAPKLRIDFQLNAPYCSKTPFYITFFKKDREGNEVVDKHISTEAYYFRVGIINDGYTQAKFCEVVMSELQGYEDNQWKGVEYFQQVNLKWDRGKPQEDALQYANINPSPIRILSDIGHIHKQGIKEEDTKKFHLDFLYGIGGYHPKELSPNKKYRLKIAVISENAEFVSRQFEFFWTGVWKDKPEEMFKEIIIS